MKSWDACTDEALMLSYAMGEYKAFQVLYERHSPKILGYLEKRLANKAEAEDLMQTVFLKLHSSKEKYNPKYPFLAWTFAITQNTYIDFLRKKKTVPLEQEKLIALADSKAEVSSFNSKSEEMEKALSTLPQAQREVLQLRFSEGLSFEEIAEKVGVSEVGVRKRVSRAIKKFKEVFHS